MKFGFPVLQIQLPVNWFYQFVHFRHGIEAQPSKRRRVAAGLQFFRSSLNSNMATNLPSNSPSFLPSLTSLKAYLLILIVSLISQCALGNKNDFKYVTCGSVVKLLNVQHNVRLHSHEVKYGSGSGQQSVTGVDSPDDGNSYWVIKGKVDAPCKRGTLIKCGSTIRIQHLATKRNLHSHHFQSPISHNQEVSAFGEDGAGDDLDEWSPVCSTKYWERKEIIRFKHRETQVYLHTTGDQFGRPINGQREISGYSYPEAGNEWKAMEGIYVKPDSDN